MCSICSSPPPEDPWDGLDAYCPSHTQHCIGLGSRVNSCLKHVLLFCPVSIPDEAPYFPFVNLYCIKAKSRGFMQITSPHPSSLWHVFFVWSLVSTDHSRHLFLSSKRGSHSAWFTGSLRIRPSGLCELPGTWAPSASTHSALNLQDVLTKFSH